MKGGDDRRLSIHHITAPARVGGLETVVELLAAGQQQRGHHVAVTAVLSSADDAHPFLRALRRHGVSVEAPVIAGRAYLEELAHYRKILGGARPDVLHTHGYRSDILGLWTGRRLGIPSVTTVHGFTRGDWKNRLYERLQRRAFRRFDAVVAVSKPLAAQLALAGSPASRIHVIPNGWRPRRPCMGREAARAELGLPLADVVVGWVGRLTREKAPDLAIEAAALAGNPAITVSVLGDGPLRLSLEQRVAALGIGERVRWHGEVPDADRLFKAFDCFLLSSRSEGTPMVLFEAMAAGVPIVATRVGGVPDVVGDLEAILVPPEDGAALAAAIESTVSDRSAAAARVARARRKLELEYGLDGWLDRYDEVYRDMLSRERGVAGG